MTAYLSELQGRADSIREGLRALGMVSYPGDYSDVRAALKVVEEQIAAESAKLARYAPEARAEGGGCLLIGNFQVKHFDCPDGWRDGVITNVLDGSIVSVRDAR